MCTTHIFHRRAIEQHEEFKRRCNAFFMEVIYLLSFSSNSPPDQEVTVELMNYVTGEQGSGALRKNVTKQPTVFGDSVDATPVLRSFFLQLLLRYRHVCTIVYSCQQTTCCFRIACNWNLYVCSYLFFLVYHVSVVLCCNSNSIKA